MDAFFGAIMATGTIMSAVMCQAPQGNFDAVQTALIENKPGQSMFIQTQGNDEDINVMAYHGNASVVAGKSGGMSALTGELNFQAFNDVRISPGDGWAEWRFKYESLQAKSTGFNPLETEVAPVGVYWQLEPLPANASKGGMMDTTLAEKASPVNRVFRAISAMNHLDVNAVELGPLFKFEGQEAAWGAYPHLGYHLKDLLPYAVLTQFGKDGALKIFEDGGLKTKGAIHESQGDNVQVATELVLNRKGNVFGVDGSKKINGISLYDSGGVPLWAAGDRVALLFRNSVSLTHKSQVSGNALPFALPGSLDIKLAADSVVDLVLIDNVWHVVSIKRP